jgi:antitoxin component of RelBE/YafQ-DinJ toxin-antitoxin module
MSTAIDMYLNQIYLTGGIPFSVTLPKAPDHLNADYMTREQLRHVIHEGYTDYELGNYMDASDMISEFRKKHK